MSFMSFFKSKKSLYKISLSVVDEEDDDALKLGCGARLGGAINPTLRLLLLGKNLDNSSGFEKITNNIKTNGLKMLKELMPILVVSLVKHFGLGEAYGLLEEVKDGSEIVTKHLTDLMFDYNKKEETINFYMTADHIKTNYYSKMKKLIEGKTPEYIKLVNGKNHTLNSFISGKNNISNNL